MCTSCASDHETSELTLTAPDLRRSVPLCKQYVDLIGVPPFERILGARYNLRSGGDARRIAHGNAMTSKFNARNPSVKRIMQVLIARQKSSRRSRSVTCLAIYTRKRHCWFVTALPQQKQIRHQARFPLMACRK